MERYPAMKVVVAHGQGLWMQEVLEKMDRIFFVEGNETAGRSFQPVASGW
jgi:hypothetical protein